MYIPCGECPRLAAVRRAPPAARHRRQAADRFGNSPADRPDHPVVEPLLTLAHRPIHFRTGRTSYLTNCLGGEVRGGAWRRRLLNAPISGSFHRLGSTQRGDSKHGLPQQARQPPWAGWLRAGRRGRSAPGETSATGGVPPDSCAGFEDLAAETSTCLSSCWRCLDTMSVGATRLTCVSC